MKLHEGPGVFADIDSCHRERGMILYIDEVFRSM